MSSKDLFKFDMTFAGLKSQTLRLHNYDARAGEEKGIVSFITDDGEDQAICRLRLNEIENLRNVLNVHLTAHGRHPDRRRKPQM